MAAVSFNRKQLLGKNIKVDNDYALTINERGLVVGRIGIKPGRPIRVEVRGRCQMVNVVNSLTVIGNIGSAMVGNCCRCNGTMGEGKVGNRIMHDQSLKIHTIPENKTVDSTRAQIVHIEGDLDMLDVIGPNDVQVETIIYGDVGVLTVGNTLDCKGNINYYNIGNILKTR